MESNDYIVRLIAPGSEPIDIRIDKKKYDNIVKAMKQFGFIK